MASAGSARSAKLARMAFMLAGTALATGCQTIGALAARAAPAFGGGNNQCFTAPLVTGAGDPGRLQGLAHDCAEAAGQTDSIRAHTAALFNAGSANLELGKFYLERKQEAPSGYGLPAAADQLYLVVRSTNYEVTAAQPVDPKSKNKPKPAAFDIAGSSRLELAQVYKLQGRYPEAIATLEQMLAAGPSRPNAAAKLELARVYLERSRDGAIADGSLEKAVGYLEVFASDLKGEDPALVQAGRIELVDRASQLGLAMMRGAPSRESSQRAIDAFAKAEAGANAAGATIPNDKVAAIYVKLGQAKLRMSGLPTLPASPTSFDCAAQADQFWLGEARRSFDTALSKAANSAEANAGMGCARQAYAFQIGAAPTDAIPWFERASTLAPNDIRYMLSYAGVLAASGRDAKPVFLKALSLAGTDSAETARIYVEIAKIHLRNVENDSGVREEQIAAAGESAKQAIRADTRNGAAHLMLGRALYEERKGTPGNAARAKSEFDQAIALTRLKAEQKSLYADALYHRSLLEMEAPNRSPRGAVLDAVEAANSVNDPAYQEQACLAHVRFLDSALVANGKIRCAPDESTDPLISARGLLREGMFYLATTNVPGIDHDKGWEYSIRSFEKGLERLGAGSPGEDVPTKRLRAQLGVGQAIGYRCVGLRDKGKTLMSLVDETYQTEAYDYFVTYNVRGCT